MTILLGAVGVDIPVKLLQEFSPKYRVSHLLIEWKSLIPFE